MNIRFAQAIRWACEVLFCTLVLVTLGLTHAQAGLTFKDGVTPPPVLTHFVQAEYTPEARKARFDGDCMVHLKVDEHGNPQNVRVLSPIGMGLDESAIKAVKQERFKPAMRGGRTVAFPLSMEVSFKPAH
jgi:periplasmic protein TonB